MAAPVVVALTNDYVLAVNQQLAALNLLIGADEVRAALEAAAVATDQTAPQPDLFGSTP